MEMTYKGIAMACGYYIRYSQPSSRCTWYRTEAPNETWSGRFYDTEDVMWKECCLVNGLVKPESDI